MTEISCLIIDDEPLALELLSKYISQTPFLKKVGECKNAIEAINFLANQYVDLLFLDIQMPDLSGLSLMKLLTKKPKVIFTTAFEQYALESYKVDAIDYLLKPFDFEEFLRASQKAKDWFTLNRKDKSQTQSLDFIFVKSEYKLIKIEFDQILYIEGLKDYIKIFLKSQEKPILTLMSLKSMEENLPSNQFLRVHRSFIVNLNKINSIEKNLIIIGKSLIPIADNYRADFLKFIKDNSF